MNVPRSVSLGGGLVRIRRVAQSTLDREHGPDVACADYSRKTGVPIIRLSRDLDGELLADVLFHEFGHAFSDLVLSRGSGSETEAQAIGVALRSIYEAMSEE